MVTGTETVTGRPRFFDPAGLEVIGMGVVLNQKNVKVERGERVVVDVMRDVERGSGRNTHEQTIL